MFRSGVALATLHDVELDALESLIRRRRTNLRIDAEREVPAALVERLCRLATWAPNHKRTWPWRFAALVGDARAELGERLAAAMLADGRAGDDPKVVKARTKYLRAPVMLAVAVACHDDPGRWLEDRDAVSAGVQNLLLGAEAAGLAGYWGTGQVTEVPAIKELCGFEHNDTVLAFVYLGWPIGDVPVPERPEPALRFVGS